MKVTLALCVFVGISAALALPQNEISPAIVGGADAKEGQFRYQASLRSESTNAHICGGFIYTKRWIISAAHCTLGRTTSNTNVRLGTVLRTGNSGTKYSLDRITNHELYRPGTLHNDISLLKTDREIVFSNLIGSIELDLSHIQGGINALASGWGQTSHPGSQSQILQSLEVATITNADCRLRFTTNADRWRVHDSSICTTSPAGEGLCMGDSGGPLIVGRKVIGIVSWGIACGTDKPDVFTRISSHIPWIVANTIL